MLPSKVQLVVTDENAEENIFIPTPVHNNPTAPETVLGQTTHCNMPRNRSPDCLTYKISVGECNVLKLQY